MRDAPFLEEGFILDVIFLGEKDGILEVFHVEGEVDLACFEDG